MFNTEVKLAFGNKKLHFNYSFNENTKYGDLFEYVSFLYPNFNLCGCFCFANNFNYINNDMKLIETNDINGPLHIENLSYDSKCHCSPQIKNLFQMSKMEIIKILNNTSNNNQELEKSKEIINNLKEKEKSQIMINQDLQNQLQKYKMLINNQKEINNSKAQIITLKDEEKNLSNQLNQYNKELNNLSEKIRSNKNEINNYETQIKKLKEE